MGEQQLKIYELCREKIVGSCRESNEMDVLSARLLMMMIMSRECDFDACDDDNESRMPRIKQKIRSNA